MCIRDSLNNVSQDLSEKRPAGQTKTYTVSVNVDCSHLINVSQGLISVLQIATGLKPTWCCTGLGLYRPGCTGLVQYRHGIQLHPLSHFATIPDHSSRVYDFLLVFSPCRCTRLPVYPPTGQPTDMVSTQPFCLTTRSLQPSV